MLTPRLATKEVARVFYLCNRHVMLVQGSKPRNSEVYLLEDTRSCGTILALKLPAGIPPSLVADTFYLVRPLFAQCPMRPSVQLEHQAGKESVPVEPLGCRPSSVSITGRSQAFRFDEAFADALRQLPVFQQADPALPLPLVDVVAMGALYGGFAGFSHLFLRVGPTKG